MDGGGDCYNYLAIAYHVRVKVKRVMIKQYAMRFRIRRFDGKHTWFDTFDVTPKPYMSVLEALFQIQDEQDSSLCFRYSCRGAVCGSCAMLINKKQRLACRTHVEEIAGERVIAVSGFSALAKPEIKYGNEILVEPLPNFPVIKDLVVDLDILFKHYEEMKPWFEDDCNEREHLMSQKELKRVYKYAACILCGLCYGACPSFTRNKDFYGPATLAKAFRFYADPRNKKTDEILKRVDSDTGVWACDEVYRCVEVCPKNVPPTNAITGFMRRIILHRLLPFFH